MENYRLEGFEAIVQEALLECGIAVPVPVRINGRISRALGRCIFAPKDGIVEVHIELSQRFVEQVPFEEIRQVLLHETAHLAAILYSGGRPGHDSLFREICEQLGCRGDTSYIRTTMHMKYEATCPRCGCLCYNASRRTKRWELM